MQVGTHAKGNSEQVLTLVLHVQILKVREQLKTDSQSTNTSSLLRGSNRLAHLLDGFSVGHLLITLLMEQTSKDMTTNFTKYLREVSEQHRKTREKDEI